MKKRLERGRIRNPFAQKELGKQLKARKLTPKGQSKLNDLKNRGLA